MKSWRIKLGLVIVFASVVYLERDLLRSFVQEYIREPWEDCQRCPRLP